MGNYTRPHTFDALKHYVAVRLQQGVPLIDADWNEKDDIRRHEIRTFLKWFVGDGVPHSNFGFQLEPLQDEFDFVIKGGDGTHVGGGRCFVDGLEVVNESDINYSDQEDVPPIEPPSNIRTDLVYLDVWEREVDSAEDPDLKDERINEETCVRVKREWRVRVTPDEEVPDPELEHAYYSIARLHLQRQGVSGFTDLRRTGLQISSIHNLEKVRTDAFGEAYLLEDKNKPELQVSLRDAINALLKEELPYTTNKNLRSRAVIDHVISIRSDTLWLASVRLKNGNHQLLLTQYSEENGELTRISEVKASNAIHWSPNGTYSLLDKSESVWTFWVDVSRREVWAGIYTSGQRYRRELVPLPDPPSGLERESVEFPIAIEYQERKLCICWLATYKGDIRRIEYCFFDSQSGWKQPGIVENIAPLTEENERVALLAIDNTPYIIWISHNQLMSVQWYKDGFTNELEVLSLADSSTGISDLIASYDHYNHPMLCFSSKETLNNQEIRQVAVARFFAAHDMRWVWQYVTEGAEENEKPYPLVHSNGKIYLFWQHKLDETYSIQYKYTRLPTDTEYLPWSHTIDLPGDPIHNLFPNSLVSYNGDIWVFTQNIKTQDIQPGELDEWRIRYRKLLFTI